MSEGTYMLSALRDVTGVEGSFYAARDGRILARDMPRIYDGDAFEGVATRLSRMLDALAELGGANEGTLIRHPHHALFVRPTEHGLLGVLATSDVNVPSLKRGASLVARRLPPPEAVPDERLSAPARMSSPDFTPVPSGLPVPHPASGLLSQPPLPQATMTLAATPPPLPPSAREPAPPPDRQSSPGSGAKPLPTQRASVPGAPAATGAMRWRGTPVKD